MPWSAPISSLDVVAIHAALLPTPDGGGEIVLFGGDDHDRAANEAGQWNHSRRFSCRNPTLPLAFVQSPDADLFCCGHAFLGDGRLLTAGGTITFPPDSMGIHAHAHFEGHRRSFSFAAGGITFTEVAQMGPQPGFTSQGGGRWYPTLVTLPSGEVLAVAGHPAGDDTRHNNNVPERYQPLFDHWVPLLPTGPDSVGGPDLYPRLHVLRDGTVFVSSALQGNSGCIAIDPWTGAKHDVCDLAPGDYAGFDCPSVLLPLTPADGYQARVLVAGDTESHIVDLGAAAPAWQGVPRNGATAGSERHHAHATLLPTGDVLLNGGADGATDQVGVNLPELYSLPIDHASPLPSYSGGVGRWDTINDAASVLRNYHSTALLMPDGRVWTAGGNSPTQPNTPPSSAQEQIEIYDPPYPAGPRPRITGCPRVVGYGDQFVVRTPQAASIRSVTLLACGSATHAFNVGQRCIFLDFSVLSSGRLAVTAPPGGTIAPPGSYMLFLVDNQGRPCQYASFVRVGGSMSMFTQRANISHHEIQALEPALGGPASIEDALYVVLDGFTGDDLAGSPDRPFPPTLAFTFQDDGSTVPDLDYSLSSTLRESPSAPSNLVQRVTLGFRLTFQSESAFNGIPAGGDRTIVATATWGSSRTVGEFHLYEREHVYLLAGPISYLSIDVQVMTLARGASFAGLADNDPATFIGSLIHQLRTSAPGPAHPFQQLANLATPEQLELSDTVGGVRQDNFALARVRFRAPVGVSATGVKLFFRMFSTQSTAVDYQLATYPHLGTGPSAVAQPGIVAGEVVTQPFFAAARNVNPNTQADPDNVDDFHGAGGTEVESYFGAWLDFNHVQAICDRIRGRHQCLIAEIHFPAGPPIPLGVSPGNTDLLAQRNLAIVESDNPGGAATHVVAHTVDLAPGAGVEVGAVGLHGQFPQVMVAANRLPNQPDELFIRWNQMPAESFASLYLPGADVARMVEYAGLRPGYPSLSVIDDKTVGFRVGEASYLPLIGPAGQRLAGLLTIQLPPTVRSGQRFRVNAHQVSGDWRRTFRSSFDLDIRVGDGPQIVSAEMRAASVLKQIGATIGSTDRWRPVFDRYLALLEAKVTGLGGYLGGPSEDLSGGHSPKVVCGKVLQIRYDRFGDFDGFELILEDGQTRSFRGRERAVEELVREAWLERFLVCLPADVGVEEWPDTIILRRAPDRRFD